MFTKPHRDVGRVFIHCTASNDTTLVGQSLVDEIDRWHNERGWNGIGYHYVIDQAGTVLPGRDIERIPAAQKGHNTGSIAIVCHGLHEEDFTMHQLTSLRLLCNDINSAYNNITFHGHCEVSNKTCPVFDYAHVLQLDKSGIMLRK